MGFADEMLEALMKKRCDVKPICILKDHLDLARKHAIYVETCDAKVDKMREMYQEIEAYRDAFMDDLLEQLKEKGLITRESVKKSCGTIIENGVVSIYYEKGKDE